MEWALSEKPVNASSIFLMDKAVQIMRKVSAERAQARRIATFSCAFCCRISDATLLAAETMHLQCIFQSSRRKSELPRRLRILRMLWGSLPLPRRTGTTVQCTDRLPPAWTFRCRGFFIARLSLLIRCNPARYCHLFRTPLFDAFSHYFDIPFAYSLFSFRFFSFKFIY